MLNHKNEFLNFNHQKLIIIWFYGKRTHASNPVLWWEAWIIPTWTHVPFKLQPLKKKLSSSHNSACTIKKQSTMDHVMKSDKNKIYNLKWAVKIIWLQVPFSHHDLGPEVYWLKWISTNGISIRWKQVVYNDYYINQ